MIEVAGLSRRYGGTWAVRDINLCVGPGQVLALLGPNGAGKSTTLRMIAGYLAPSAGTVRVCGRDVLRHPKAVHRLLGYLPEGAPVYEEMSVRSFLGFIADVRGLRGLQRRQRFEEVVQMLGLEEVLHSPTGTLSMGYRRRLGLAQAILHDPPALIFDEPTDGLDPSQRYEVRKLIRSLARDHSLIVSTHLLEEVRAVCNRVALIVRGRLVVDTTPAELAEQSRYHGAVSFTAKGSGSVRAALGLLPSVDTVEIDPMDGRVTIFPKPGREILPQVQQLLTTYQVIPKELQLEEGRLDDVFETYVAAARGHPE